MLRRASIVKALEDSPHSVGYLSQCFHSAAQALPSTLSMPSQTGVLYLRDEICALHAPMLVTMDARSTAILTMELAADRSADTWRAHGEAREAPHCSSLGMASDRGLGLVAGSHAACNMALWVAESCHAFRDLFAVLHQLERQASTAIGKADDAAHTFARATSASTLAKRLQQYAQAHHACAPAIALDDHRAMLRP